MAEKKEKAQTAQKTAKAQPKSKAADKSTAKAETKTSAKPASAPKSTAKAEAKAVAKSASAPKPAAKAEIKASAKPASASKPAAKAETKASAKPASASKPAAKGETKAETKMPKQAADKPKKNKKTEKPKADKKAVGQSEQKTDKGRFGKVTEFLSNKKVRIILISALAAVLTLTVVLCIVMGVKSCRKEGVPSGNLSDVQIAVPERGTYILGSDIIPNSDYDAISSGSESYFEEDIASSKYDTSFKTNTAVGYSGKIVGSVERVIPERTRDEGLAVYPQYGYTLSTVIGGGEAQVAGRDALIKEANYLTATGTSNAGTGGYTWMDRNGYLYAGTTAEPMPTLDKSGRQRRLYKHSASIGLYGGDVSDSERGIIKTVTMRPRGYNGYGVTGVYAPAGEVIKIQLSERDMNATGGIVVHIGQALYNGQANNIWTAKNQMQRIPVLLNTMAVNKNTSVYDEQSKTYTAYVGSFIGGPLYIRNTNVQFTATISGGVKYSHFIFGYTTEEEFNENAQSSAPYFDLEVWHYGVLHSGPKRQANGFTYEDIYNAAQLWDKVASVTTTNSNQGIVFLYESFVAAGAAVAFPGRRSVNCPEGWMRNSLNYNSVVNSGAWGNFHEYHHNFQGYGVGNGGEVTNNGMTLVSYSLFTRISANRGILNCGAQGLGGWNNYTSASWALNEVLKIQQGQTPGNGKQGLALYAALLHNFGPDAYIQTKARQQGQRYGENYSGYLRAWQDITHNDMTYFFKDVLQGLDPNRAEELKNPDYPTFVPVSSVYQTGRSYMYDDQKKYITTMQPYVIPYGRQFTVDLRKYTEVGGQYSYGSVVIPDGFTYTVKDIAQPENGTLTPTDTEGVYLYTPAASSSNLRSGDIKVTLQITKDDGAFEVDDVDLILEFEQSHESNKFTIERTTYTFAADGMYKDAQTAYENSFDGYTDVVRQDQFNPTQNCNTDIWFRPDTENYRNQFPNDPEKYFAHDNTIEVLDGKLYFENEGKYRIYLRGRLNCALYYSLDGETYTLGATIKDETAPNGSQYFRANDENTYFDLELEAESWIYIREVLIVQNYGNSCSYIGVGMRQWTDPMFTMVDRYYDANGNEVESESAEGYEYTVTHYYDYRGQEVTEEEANSTELIPPIITQQQQPYVNAYRNSYEFPDGSGFKTEYFYKRAYNYNYVDNSLQNSGQTIVSSKYSPAPHSNWGGYPFNQEKLVDGDRNTWIHTSGNVSSQSPLEFVMDIGSPKTFNRMVMYSQNRRDLQIPKAFVLYGSHDGENFSPIFETSDAPNVGASVTVNFQAVTFRYYKIQITRSSGGFIILSEIELWSVNEVNGGNHISPDNEMFDYEGDWHGEQAYSCFGHVYVGGSGDTMKFEFTGTRIGILSSKGYGNSFEVYIDGNKAESIALKDDDGAYYMSYICEALEEGTHRVELRCTAEASVDSVVIFP